MKEQESGVDNSFKKGMTLNEYFGEMKMEKDKQDHEEEIVQENLYETSQNVKFSVSKKLITYQIREIDEDNYDQSFEESQRQDERHQKLSTNLNLPNEQRSSIKLNFNKTQNEGESSNTRGFRVRKHSNSPYANIKKESSLSPNKNLVKTLYNNEWKITTKEESTKPALGSTTLYGKFLKGVKEKRNQKYFKKKNTKQLDYVLKYEQNLNSKYSKYNVPDIRVDGITDRLHERKNYKLFK